LLAGCWPKVKTLQSACNLKASDFEKSIEGKNTSLHIMRNGDIELAITNYGARIVCLLTPDRQGKY
jgi:aldose 1-epimerase